MVKVRAPIQDLTDDKPHQPIQRADARSRRKALIFVILGLIIGSIGLALLEHFRAEWEIWLEQAVVDWIRRPARGGFIVFLLTSPLWSFAWYLGRIADRTKAAQRWPPPNLPMARDTPIVSGDAAFRRGRLLFLAALLSWLIPILCGLWFWWTLTLLGD
jgi:H+/Cl- antiporter ClcA